MNKKSLVPIFALIILIFNGCASLIGASMRQPEPPPSIRIGKGQRFAVLKRLNFKDTERFLDSAITIRKLPILPFNNDSIGIPDFKLGMPVNLTDFPIADSIDFCIYPFNFDVKLATLPAGVIGYNTWNSYRAKIAVIRRDSAFVAGVFEVKGFSQNWSMTFSKKGYLYNELGEVSILPDYDKARMEAVKDFITKIDAVSPK